MAEARSAVRITERLGVLHVEFLERDVLDEATIRTIGTEIITRVQSETSPRLLISFANVEHLSSAALGTLITINQQVKQRSGQLRLAEIRPSIMEVFQITKLNRIFSIHESSEAAAKSFQ